MSEEGNRGGRKSSKEQVEKKREEEGGELGRLSKQEGGGL